MHSSTPYHLELANPSDLPILAEIETEAMQSSALNSIFFQSWADTKVQARFFQSNVEDLMRTPKVQIIKAISTTTGVIDGYVAWYIEESPATSAAPDYKTAPKDAKHSSTTSPETLSSPSDPLNAEFCNIVFAETKKLKADLLHGQKCAYLNKLFVRPGSQKHGIGSLLVEWVFKKADANGLDTYLISVPDPHEFYLHRGFEDRGCYDVDLSPWGPKFGGFGVFRFQGMVRIGAAEKN